MANRYNGWETGNPSGSSVVSVCHPLAYFGGRHVPLSRDAPQGDLPEDGGRYGAAANMSDYEQIRQRIATIKARRPAYATRLEFFDRIFAKQYEYRERLLAKGSEAGSTQLGTHVSADEPLLGPGGFEIDRGLSRELFLSLCAALRSAGDLVEKIEEVEAAVADEVFDLGRLLAASAAPRNDACEQVSGRCSLDFGALRLLSLASIRPFVEAQAEKLAARRSATTWKHGFCPVCGADPLLAELRGDEGARVLLCSFCAVQWPFRRVACPYCGNQDHTSLHYLLADDDPAYRIDVCDKCKQYVKTVDARELDGVRASPVDAVATMHLDIVAQEKGFRRPQTSLYDM